VIVSSPPDNPLGLHAPRPVAQNQLDRTHRQIAARRVRVTAFSATQDNSRLHTLFPILTGAVRTKLPEQVGQENPQKCRKVRGYFTPITILVAEGQQQHDHR
jgi:hypothetical protein